MTVSQLEVSAMNGDMSWWVLSQNGSLYRSIKSVTDVAIPNEGKFALLTTEDVR